MFSNYANVSMTNWTLKMGPIPAFRWFLHTFSFKITGQMIWESFDMEMSQVSDLWMGRIPLKAGPDSLTAHVDTVLLFPAHVSFSLCVIPAGRCLQNIKTKPLCEAPHFGEKGRKDTVVLHTPSVPEPLVVLSLNETTFRTCWIELALRCLVNKNYQTTFTLLKSVWQVLPPRLQHLLKAAPQCWSQQQDQLSPQEATSPPALLRPPISTSWSHMNHEGCFLKSFIKGIR